MADKNLTIIVKGKDNSTQAFKKVNGNLVKTKNNAKELNKKLASIGKNIKSAGKKMSLFLTAPIIAFGTKSVDNLMKFNQSMSDINTLFDDNGQKIAIMKKGITDLLKHSPKSADDLGGSAYDIVSAGISNANQALKVLNNTQKLAVVGLGTTKEATDIVTSAINAFGLNAEKSADIANTVFLGVKAGKTTVADLAQGFGRVASLASKTGISFKNLIGMTAAMTSGGGGAAEQYVKLKAILMNLLKPTDEMALAMKKAGISTDNIRKVIQKNGLVGVIHKLSDAVGGNQSNLSKMFISSRGLNGALLLLGDTGKKAVEIQKNMATQSGALTEGYKKQSKEARFQYNVMKNQLGIVMRDLARVILPPLIKAVRGLTNFLSKLTDKQKKLIVIFGGVVAVVGPLLIILGTLATAIAFLATPIGTIMLAIGGLILIGTQLYRNWGKIKKAAKDLGTYLKKIWGEIKDYIKESVNNIIWFLDKLIEKFKKAIEWIKKYSGYNAITGAIGKVGSFIGNTFGGHRAEGGSVNKDSTYLVGERGAELFTPSQSGYIVANGAGAGGAQINISIRGNTLLDRQSGEKIGDQIIKKLKLVTNI